MNGGVYLLAGIMMSSVSSTDQEVKLNQDSSVPRAIRLLMAMSSASPALTIGEHNKKLRLGRCLLWISIVFGPSLFIAISAGLAYTVYNRPTSIGLPLHLLVYMLSFLYQAVVLLALGLLALFVPQAPFPTWDALFEVGFRFMGLAVPLTSCAIILLFNHTGVLIAWACLLATLIAAVLNLWLCLFRTYGE